MSKSVKRIILFNAIVVTLLLIGISVHPYLFDLKGQAPKISYVGIYLFFAISASVIITGIELLFDVMSDKVGYAFLVGIFLKLGFFTVMFLSKGLLDKPLTMSERLGIVMPLFLFLIVEVIAIGTRLKQAWDSNK